MNATQRKKDDVITNVELLQTMYTQALQHGMKQTETSLANATLKKFAELIVLQSVEVAEDTAMGEPTYGWMIANNIKEHFGVKE